MIRLTEGPLKNRNNYCMDARVPHMGEKEYRVVIEKETRVEDFGEKISQLMNEGWKLYSSPSISSSDDYNYRLIIQALTRGN